MFSLAGKYEKVFSLEENIFLFQINMIFFSFSVRSFCYSQLKTCLDRNNQYCKSRNTNIGIKFLILTDNSLVKCFPLVHILRMVQRQLFSLNTNSDEWILRRNTHETQSSSKNLCCRHKSKILNNNQLVMSSITNYER